MNSGALTRGRGARDRADARGAAGAIVPQDPRVTARPLRSVTRVISRRTFVLAGAAALGLRQPIAAQAAPRPRPSPSQLAWQRDELALFLHFGVNTFTDREWGDGREDPAIFAPSRLDARQWARAARAAGFRAMILTAKHHDGFCLWPTDDDDSLVARSPWRGGHGDVVREFVDACRAEGLTAGLYCRRGIGTTRLRRLTPLQRSLRRDQLTELLTQLRRDRRSLVRRRERRRAEREAAGLRLAATSGRWSGGCSPTP